MVKMAGMEMGTGNRVVIAMIENSKKWLRLNGRRMEADCPGLCPGLHCHSWVMTTQTGP